MSHAQIIFHTTLSELLARTQSGTNKKKNMHSTLRLERRHVAPESNFGQLHRGPPPLPSLLAFVRQRTSVAATRASPACSRGVNCQQREEGCAAVSVLQVKTCHGRPKAVIARANLARPSPQTVCTPDHSNATMIV